METLRNQGNRFNGVFFYQRRRFRSLSCSKNKKYKSVSKTTSHINKAGPLAELIRSQFPSAKVKGARNILKRTGIMESKCAWWPGILKKYLKMKAHIITQ